MHVVYNEPRTILESSLLEMYPSHSQEYLIYGSVVNTKESTISLNHPSTFQFEHLEAYNCSLTKTTLLHPCTVESVMKWIVKRNTGKQTYPCVAYSDPPFLITIFVHVLCWLVFSESPGAEEALFQKKTLVRPDNQKLLFIQE